MNRLLLILFTLLFFGCGKDDAPQSDGTTCGLNSQFVGYWAHPARNDILTINSNCTFSGSYCASSGTMLPVSGSSSQIILNINSSNGISGCTSSALAGTCSYQITQNKYLSLSCGLGLVTYTRQ